MDPCSLRQLKFSIKDKVGKDTCGFLFLFLFNFYPHILSYILSFHIFLFSHSFVYTLLPHLSLLTLSYILFFHIFLPPPPSTTPFMHSSEWSTCSSRVLPLVTSGGVKPGSQSVSQSVPLLLFDYGTAHRRPEWVAWILLVPSDPFHSDVHVCKASTKIKFVKEKKSR